MELEYAFITNGMTPNDTGEPSTFSFNSPNTMLTSKQQDKNYQATPTTHDN